MNCYIKRYNKENEFRGYFSSNLKLRTMVNHWVQQRKEAKLFTDGRTAQGFIKKYKLKNCEVEYE